MKSAYLLFLSALMVILGGCGHVISETHLRQVDPLTGFAALAANPDAHLGKTILAGGVLEDFSSSGDVFEIQVAHRELFANGVPDELSLSGGRFIAIGTGPVEQSLYRPGKLVSLVGEVKGRTIRKVADQDHDLPLLAIREVRLFRAPEPFPTSDHPYQNRFGDEKFLRRPPGLAEGEPGTPAP